MESGAEATAAEKLAARRFAATDEDQRAAQLCPRRARAPAAPARLPLPLRARRPGLRRAAHVPRRHAPRRRAGQPEMAPAPAAPAPHRRADRRLRLDEGAHAGASFLRACADARRRRGRGVHHRHAAHARHPRAAPAQPRAGADRRLAAGARLGRRHAHRRGARRLPRGAALFRAGARGGRGRAVRRARARRPGRHARRGRAPVAHRLARRLADAARHRCAASSRAPPAWSRRGPISTKSAAAARSARSARMSSTSPRSGRHERNRRRPSSHLAAARSALARRADAAAHFRALRADPPRLSDRRISRRHRRLRR